MSLLLAENNYHALHFPKIKNDFIKIQQQTFHLSDESRVRRSVCNESHNRRVEGRVLGAVASVIHFDVNRHVHLKILLQWNFTHPEMLSSDNTTPEVP